MMNDKNDDLLECAIPITRGYIIESVLRYDDGVEYGSGKVYDAARKCKELVDANRLNEFMSFMNEIYDDFTDVEMNRLLDVHIESMGRTVLETLMYIECED